MLATIKKILLNKSGNALAEYYQSRLQASKSAVEVEAIFNMNSFMSFTEEEQQSEQSK